MPFTVLLCADGSDLSLAALASGLALLSDDAKVAVVSVADTPDVELLSGSGFSGADLTPEEFDRDTAAAIESARGIVAATIDGLGLEGADSYVVGGDPGAAICELASELSAGAIVMGSRGRGGLKRAVLGSVSDHVVRNSPCAVVVSGDRGLTGPG